MAEEVVRELKEDWYLTIGDKVMATVKAHLNKNDTLKKKFKVSTFTVNSNVAPDTPAKFPSIFYTELNPIELGQDLENTEINAIRCTVEVRAYVNTGKDEDCQALLRPIIEDFKKFRFNVSQFPIYSKTNNTVEGIIRCTRVVGVGDEELTYKITKKTVT